MNLVIDLSNNTKYPDAPEYIGFTPWSTAYTHLHFWLVQSMALTGNSIVIYTSVKLGSLNMDSISSVLLENVAVADIILAVIGGWPVYITFCAKRWVLGKAGCILALYLTNVGGTAEILILAVISLYRGMMLKDPFLFRGVSTVKIKIGLLLIWLISLTPAVISVSTSSTVYYEPKKLSCTSSAYTSPSTFIIVALGLGILIGVPMICILVSNTFMLVASIRYKRRSTRMRSGTGEDDGNMKAVVTVNVVCWLFIFSWSPFVVRILCDATGVPLPVWFFIFQAHFLSLNIVLNPIIYILTNRSFRDVVKKRVFGVIFARCTKSQVEPDIGRIQEEITNA